MARRIEKILPFRDVAPKTKELEGLLNLGPKSSQWLRDAGIDDVETLRELGPIEACRRVRATGRPVSSLLAYAIEGGLSGTHWAAIPTETKNHLRHEFAQMKRLQNHAKPLKAGKGHNDQLSQKITRNIPR